MSDEFAPRNYDESSDTYPPDRGPERDDVTGEVIEDEDDLDTTEKERPVETQDLKGDEF